VELLVVIAIISILASLLMPALENAIEQARRVDCLNNQRQIYMAAVNYSTDFRGWAPPGTNADHGLVRAGSWYSMDFYGEYVGLPLDAAGNITSPQGILYCPGSIRQEDDRGWWEGNPGAWRSGCTGYALVGCAVYNGNAAPYPARTNQLWRGERVFSMDLSLWSGKGFQTSERIAPHTPHWGTGQFPDGLNLVYVDGHGAWMPQSECNPVGGNRPNGVWQYFDNWKGRLMPGRHDVLPHNPWWNSSGGYIHVNRARDGQHISGGQGEDYGYRRP
jgi:hypothetical protein